MELKELRKFGLILGVLLLLLTLYQWKFHDRLWEVVAVMGALFLLIGLIMPQALRVIYRPWMWGAEKIGFVMNRVILTIFFIFFLTPIALVRRLFHRDPLGLKWDKNRTTYFEPKAVQPAERFSNLF